MLDSTRITLLNLVSNALFNTPILLPDNVDWYKVYQESKLQAVSVLAFSAVQRKWLSASVAAEWENDVNQTLVNNSRINSEHAQLHSILSENSISYVVLKGSASAAFYPDPILRSMGDVDFLVKESDVNNVDMLLQKNGFVPQLSNHECERAYHNSVSVWELHWSVNGVPGGKSGRIIQEYLKDIIIDASCESSLGGEYMAPTIFHHGLVMLLHIARHIVTSGIGLRHLCDWAVFVEKIGCSFDTIFEKKLESIGLWYFAQQLTQLSVRYLGGSPQNWMGDYDYRLLAELQDDIFDAGNFGVKEPGRKDESRFITNRKKGTVNNNSSLIQAIFSANEIVRRHWNFVDRIPLLFPFGWIYFGSRYSIRTIKGTRKRINLFSLAESAKQRKELYKKLLLFDIKNI